MSTNINNKSSIVNNSNEELSYFTLNKKVFKELILRPRPKTVLFQIMVHLACNVTYKNGLVGVHSELYKTGLAQELGINDGDISRYLKQLEELNFIKIFNTTPLILQVLEVPQAPEIRDIKGVLLYIHLNLQQFNFHRNLKRKTAFFKVFQEYDNQILVERIKRAEVPEKHPSNPTQEELNDIFGFNE